jgi:hypothetical protein
MPDLINLAGDQLHELVQSLPVGKRSAFHKAAKAACKHLKDSRAEYAKAFELNWAILENAWRLGNDAQQLKSQGHLCPGSAMKKHPPKNGSLITWAKLGITSQDGGRLIALRDQYELPELEAWFREQYDEQKYRLVPVYRASSVAAAGNSGECEWYTPELYIELARDVMGQIDTDPASNALANETVKAGIYFDSETNGLVQDWHGSVWLNPPYAAGLVSEFAARLTDQIAVGNTKQAILLVNNATDTQWFSDTVKDAKAVCFKTGRIAFVNQDGDAVTGAAQGQCFMYFGRRTQRFCNLFGTIGWIALF